MGKQTIGLHLDEYPSEAANRMFLFRFVRVRAGEPITRRELTKAEVRHAMHQHGLGSWSGWLIWPGHKGCLEYTEDGEHVRLTEEGLGWVTAMLTVTVTAPEWQALWRTVLARQRGDEPTPPNGPARRPPQP